MGLVLGSYDEENPTAYLGIINYTRAKKKTTLTIQ